jgi:hypothetical protein
VRRGVVGVAHHTKVAQHISFKKFQPEPEGVYPRTLLPEYKNTTVAKNPFFSKN